MSDEPDELGVLSDEEFGHLTPDEQELYLDALSKVLGEWTLTGKQLAADHLADQVNEMCYGGAAGGGKSEWLMHRANRLSMEIPGHATLLLRSSFPELRRSLIRRSIVLFARNPIEQRPKWHAADKEWRFPNGSVIEFGYCESDDDVGQFLSAEYDMVGFDELTEFSLYQYDMIRSRARTTKAKLRLGARPHVVGATNPGRRGHAWVKKLFVAGTDYGRHSAGGIANAVYARTIDEGDYDFSARDMSKEPIERGWRRIGFMPATVLDNPHIDPGYVAHLMSLPSTLKRQYLEGDWDCFEGQYFPEFQRSSVADDGTTTPMHVIEPFEIPFSWPRIRAIDWGYTAPFCCLWLTFDEDGNCFVYRELYLTGLTPEEQAEKILAASMSHADGRIRPEKIDYTMADPASWAQRGTGPGLSIAAQWASAGLHCRKADNDRIAGWQRVREYLKVLETGPGMRFFVTAENLVRTLPEMIHDKNKPEDLDTTLEDHAVDALRYGVMSRPRKMVKRKQGPDLTTAEGRAQAHLKTFDRKRKSSRQSTEIGSY